MGMEDIVENVAIETASGYGAGIVMNVLFQVASGGIVPGTPISAVISGPLVLIFTAIGFGIGFARGWRAHRKSMIAEAAKPA